MDTAAYLFGGLTTAVPAGKASSSSGGGGGGSKGGSQLPRRYKCTHPGCGKAFTKVRAYEGCCCCCCCCCCCMSVLV